MTKTSFYLHINKWSVNWNPNCVYVHVPIMCFSIFSYISHSLWIVLGKNQKNELSVYHMDTLGHDTKKLLCPQA